MEQIPWEAHKVRETDPHAHQASYGRFLRRWVRLVLNSSGGVQSESVLEKKQLNGLRVAILADDGFEQAELAEPRRALDEAGAETRVISPQRERVRGWASKQWGQELAVDVPLDAAEHGEYDALLLPGGVINADSLRMQPKAVEFVKDFLMEGKPVAVICHGPWAIIETGLASGRRMTSWPSLKTDLRNAGVNWVDEEVVVDRDLVSSRKPADIPAFNEEMVKLFAKAITRVPSMT